MADPDARRVSFRSTTKSDPPANRIVPPLPGSDADPTAAGGSVTVYDSAGTGQVVTVEPGLYYPGRGAVRIEDMVLVEPTGCRNLTRSPKMELLEL